MYIYFDNNLVDNDYVTGISFDGKAFNDNDIFELGATICQTVTLKVSKDLNIAPVNTVELMGRKYLIDNVTEKNNDVIYTLVDKMVNLNFRYNAEPLIEASQTTEPDGTKYVTLLQIVEDICYQAGMTLYSTTFHGYDKHISYFDNTITAREYIAMVAELSCSYAQTTYDGQLEFISWAGQDAFSMSLEDANTIEIGESHTITKVAIENGIFTPVGNDNGDTIYLNPNNVYITEQSDVNYIYNMIANLTYYSLKAEIGGINYNVNDGVGRWVTFTLGNESYRTLNQVKATYNGAWNVNYHFKPGSTKQVETAVINSTEDNYKRLKFELNRNSNEISLLAEEKLDSSDYTKAEIVARINDNTSQVKIDADNVDISGKTINLTSEEIVIDSTNFKVSKEGRITSSEGVIAGFEILKSGLMSYYYAPYNYTQSDIDRISAILLGTVIPTDEDYEKYDLNEDGNITSKDLIAVQRFIDYGITTTRPLEVGIDTGRLATDCSFIIKVGNTEYIKIQLSGANFKKLSAGNIDCGDGTVSSGGTYIQFNKIFDSVPKVVATPYGVSGNIPTLNIVSVTVYGFTVETSSASNIQINWIAMS